MAAIKHIIFLLNLLAFISGLAALLMLLLTWYRSRSKNLAYYLVIYALLYVLALLSTLYTYIEVNIPGYLSDIIYYYFSFITIEQGIIFYFLIMLFYSLLNKSITVKRRIVIMVISCIPVVYTSFALIKFKTAKTFVSSFDTWFIASSVLVIIFLLLFIINLNKIRMHMRYSFHRRITATTIIYYTFFLCTMVLIEVMANQGFFVFFLDKFYFSLFFILHNTVCVIFCIKYFSRTFDSLEKPGIDPDFMEQFLITPREKEIIELIIEGKSNNEIANQLSLTEGTVKVFIYNIFQKVKVKNRTSLVQAARRG